MIQIKDHTRTIALLAPTLVHGERIMRDYMLRDIPKVVRYKIVTPQINMSGSKIHGVFDPYNMMANIDHQEWLDNNVRTRLVRNG